MTEPTKVTDAEYTDETVESTAPVEQPQSQLSIVDISILARLIEDLSKQGRLSTLEIDGVKEAFERVAKFLVEYDAYIKSQQEAPEEQKQDVA